MASEKSIRILRNTLILYFRMFLVMAISIYTARITLLNLGLTDFGIYNIVGGIVAIFSFMHNSLSVTTQRFLSRELAHKNEAMINTVFNSALLIYISIALVIIILSESLGLWWASNKLNLPIERHHAAISVFHISVLNAAFTIARLPFTAAINAYERMRVFAWLGLAEVIFKLGVVLILPLCRYDRIVIYAAFLAGIAFLILVCNVAYCWYFLPTTRLNLSTDKGIQSELLQFTGWSTLGELSVISKTQGFSIILNFFYGVGVNAAIGIANQVVGSVTQFVGGFQMAFRPQLMQSFHDDIDYFFILLHRAVRASYLLLLFLTVPIALNVRFLLELWLTQVPQYATAFIQILLANALVESVSTPLAMSAQAQGQIRNYQIWISLLNCLALPITWLLLKNGQSPIVALGSLLVINICTTAWRIHYLERVIHLDSRHFLSKTCLPLLKITLAAGAIPYISTFLCSSWKQLILTSMLWITSFITIVWHWGLEVTEREFASTIIRKNLRRDHA